jgi:hypothetical protein
MVKGIRIGASLADFMGGTNFIQSHGDHDAADQLACLECNALTAEQYADKVAIWRHAFRGERFVATGFQLQELLYVADMAQDTLSNTGDFADAGRAAGIRRSMDAWVRDYRANGFTCEWKGWQWEVA